MPRGRPEIVWSIRGCSKAQPKRKVEVVTRSVCASHYTLHDVCSGSAEEGGSGKEKGASVSQLEVFQLILQKQCDAMVALGVDPSIKVNRLVIKVWLILISQFMFYAGSSQADLVSLP